MAAYRTLTHGELLELVGSRAVGAPRGALRALPVRARRRGARVLGRPARRRSSTASAASASSSATSSCSAARVLPLVHRRGTVQDLLQPRSAAERQPVLRRALGHVALAAAVPHLLLALRHGPARARSRVLPLRRGRTSPASILERTRHALRELDPADNPYVHWILTGTHGDGAAAARFGRSTSRPSATASIGSSGTASRSRSTSSVCTGAIDRSLQPERPLRVRVGSSTTTGCCDVDRPPQPAAARGSPTGTCWRRGGVPKHGAIVFGRSTTSPARLHLRRPRVLLQRLSPRGGRMLSARPRRWRSRRIPGWPSPSRSAHSSLLFGGLQVYARATAARPETTRKMFHAGSGVLTLAFPFLFHETWPVLLLTGASALLIAAVKFLPALRARYGSVANRVERTTLGELYFPVSVGAAVLADARRAHAAVRHPRADADLRRRDVGARRQPLRHDAVSRREQEPGRIHRVRRRGLPLRPRAAAALERGRARGVAADRGDARAAGDAARGQRLARARQPVHPDRRLLPAARVPAPRRGRDLLPRLCRHRRARGGDRRRQERTTLEDDSLVAGRVSLLRGVGGHGMALARRRRWRSSSATAGCRRRRSTTAAGCTTFPPCSSVWAPAIGWLALARSQRRRGHCSSRTPSCSARTSRCSASSRLASQFPDRSTASLFWRAVVDGVGRS